MENNHLIAPNTVFCLKMASDQTQIRLDKYLCAQFPLYSRTFFQQLIIQKLITVNGISQIKPSLLLKAHDDIIIKFPGEPVIDVSNKIDPQLPITIIAEHEHFLIINKPANLMVHAPQHESQEFTLVDWILKNHTEIANIGCIDRPGIVHRLDKDTSGIIIIPRTNFAHTQLSSLFANRAIHKTYHAIVQGHPEKSGIIDAPIGRCKYNKTKMAISPGTTGPVRNAISHYTVLEYFENSSLIEIKPVTGRTHQIRVHMASIGHPIIGDKVYGTLSPLIDRQALHAYSINFEFNHETHYFIAPLTDDIEKTLEKLRCKAI